MNWWDVATVFFVLMRIRAGWRNGLVNEIFRLIALIAGAGGALWGALIIQDLVAAVMGNTPAAGLVALLVAFAIIALVFFAIGRIITMVLHKIFLEHINRAAGAVFGIATGVLLALVVSFLIMLFSTGGFGNYVGGSLTGRWATDVAGEFAKSLGIEHVGPDGVDTI